MEQGNNLNTIGYRKLIAWQKADELAFQIYQVTKNFPSEEKFGLISQMRRAALSTAANIAEGYAKNSTKDKINFYNIALGSLTEIEYYLDFSSRLSYISDIQYQNLTKLRSETGRLLNGLTKGTRNKWQRTSKVALASLFLISGFWFHVSATQAATLYFSPSSGSYAAGATLTLGVYVSSGDKSMNAVSSVISFPPDKIEVLSIDKSDSIISLWVQKPSFSNSLGTINLEGIVLNPGFQGDAGRIIRAHFKVKNVGSSAINFSSASVLANDGQGTNILSEIKAADFNIISSSIAPDSTPPPALTQPLPGAPEIFSSTHPDQNKWYADKNLKLEWSLLKDISGIRMILDKKPDSIPEISSPEFLKSFDYRNLENGIWYFHLRFKNQSGWGKTSHFKIQIDSDPPESLSIKLMDGKETTSRAPSFCFEAKDALSGINYFQAKIGEKNFVKIDGASYSAPLLEPGKHLLVVRAFDKAGNYLESSEEFIIKPIEPPFFTEFTNKISTQETLVIRGKATPDSRINIYIQRNGESAEIQSIKSNNNGNFIFAFENKLGEGIYSIWAYVIDEKGFKSDPSAKINIQVYRSGFFKFGKAAALINILIALTALAFVLAIYAWARLMKWKKIMEEEAKKTEAQLHNVFDALKENVENEIAKIDGKDNLSAKEKQASGELKKELNISENFINSKIKDIKKNLK